MKCIGIDYGTKRVGVAVSDESGSIAVPKTVLKNTDTLLTDLLRVIEEEAPGFIVIGDPVTLAGEANQLKEKVDAFTNALKQKVDIPIHLEAEAFSSVEAARFAPKSDSHNDASAAAIILQRYLDVHSQSR